MFATHIHIILHSVVSASHNNYYVLLIYLQRSSFMYLSDKYEKNRNKINSCYYREMPNVTKKNLIIIKSIIVWKWNHLFTKNYFRKKKVNHCYGFLTGRLSSYLWFNGQQKLPVPSSLNWNPWIRAFHLSRLQIPVLHQSLCWKETTKRWAYLYKKSEQNLLALRDRVHNLF